MLPIEDMNIPILIIGIEFEYSIFPVKISAYNLLSI